MLRDEQLQLAILEDASNEFLVLEDCCNDLIGGSCVSNDGNPATSETTFRPISMITLLSQYPNDHCADSVDQSSYADLKAMTAPGVAWWERTWIILTIIFVSPTFRAALRDVNCTQEQWLSGTETIPSFINRFESYICGNKNGKIACTPLEAVTEEIILWEYLNS